jgi:hypothetical protein
MAFVNEYISEADYEKYDLRKVCGEHNEVHRGHMLSQSWTIDQERSAFLIKVWSHRDSEFSGWAFHWKGGWIFFEATITGIDENLPDSSCWVGYRVREFSLPHHLEPNREEIVADLTRAFGDYCGAGVFATATKGSATIEFVEELKN